MTADGELLRADPDTEPDPSLAEAVRAPGRPVSHDAGGSRPARRGAEWEALLSKRCAARRPFEEEGGPRLRPPRPSARRGRAAARVDANGLAASGPGTDSPLSVALDELEQPLEFLMFRGVASAITPFA